MDLLCGNMYTIYDVNLVHVTKQCIPFGLLIDYSVAVAPMTVD
jgi:hypothetical protein